MSDQKIAIIGAGLSGLTVAYELRVSGADLQVDVYEATDRIGGKLHTVAFEGGPTDMGADAFMAREDVLEFIGELGLRDSLVKPDSSLIDDPQRTTFRHGFQELYEELAERSGADIYIDAFIAAISREDTEDTENTKDGKSGFRLKGGEDTVYDHVVLAVPAPTAALLLKQLAPEAAQPMSTISLVNTVVVGMRFATDEGLPAAVTNNTTATRATFTLSSRQWPHLAERGGALVRATFNEEADARADEDDLVDWALDDLEAATGFDGRAAGLEEIYVQRWFGAEPADSEDNRAAAAKAEEHLLAVPGISATGAWASGASIPDVIAHARATARGIF